MLNTINTTVPALSRHPLGHLKLANTYSLSSTNKNPLQTTISKTTANSSQTLHQLYTALNLGRSPGLFSSTCSVPTVNPMNPPSAKILYLSLQWINLTDCLLELTMEKFLENIYTKLMHTWFLVYGRTTLWSRSFWSMLKERHLFSAFYLEFLETGFCNFVKVTKLIGLFYIGCQKKTLLPHKTAYYANIEARALMKKDI